MSRQRVLPHYFPRHWRLCRIDGDTTVGDLALDAGYWVLGFHEPPAPPSDPLAGVNAVDQPDGAAVAIRIYVSTSTMSLWSASRPPEAATLREVLSKEIAGTLYAMGATSRQPEE